MAEVVVDLRDLAYQPGFHDDIGPFLSQALSEKSPNGAPWTAPLTVTIPWMQRDLTPLDGVATLDPPPLRADRQEPAPTVAPSTGRDKFANAYQVTTIVVPRRPDGLPHPMRSPVTIPSNRAVVIRGEGGRSGVAVQNTGGSAYLFSVAAGHRPVQFKNLVLYGGGIVLGADNDEFKPLGHGIAIEDCGFVLAPQWAIFSAGWPNVAVTVADCIFRASNFGDIFIGRWQSDLWSIRRCSFLESFGINLKIRSTGARVTDCNFERRLQPAGPAGPSDEVRGIDAPFVHLDIPDRVPGSDGRLPDVQHGAHGDNHFTRCRFGNETVLNEDDPTSASRARVGRVPRAIVVLGPLDAMTGQAAAEGVTFTDCLFRGKGGVEPSVEDGDAVLVLRAPARNVQFHGCSFTPNGYRWLVREDIVHAPLTPLLPLPERAGVSDDDGLKLVVAETSATNSTIARHNRAILDAPRKCFGNAVIGGPLQFRMGVFSAGGHGWELHREDRHHRPWSAGRGAANLLPFASNLTAASWVRQNVSIVDAAMGPTGAIDAVTVVRGPGTGGSGLRQRARVVSGQPYVLSVWARAAIPTIIRLALECEEVGDAAATGVGPPGSSARRAFGERDLAFDVADRWQRYFVVLPSLRADGGVDPTQPVPTQPAATTALVVVASLLVGPSADDRAAVHTGQTVQFWGPQLEAGWGPPTAFLGSREAALRTAAPHQSLVLGTRLMTYADAPPEGATPGLAPAGYQVGDIVFANRPDTLKAIGWVAVPASDQGDLRFVRWGLIDAELGREG